LYIITLILVCIHLDNGSKGELLGNSISITNNSVTTCAQFTRFKSLNPNCLNKSITDADVIIDCIWRKNYFQGRCPVFNDKLEFQYSDVPCYNGKTFSFYTWHDEDYDGMPNSSIPLTSIFQDKKTLV